MKTIGCMFVIALVTFFARGIICFIFSAVIAIVTSPIFWYIVAGIVILSFIGGFCGSASCCGGGRSISKVAK